MRKLHPVAARPKPSAGWLGITVGRRLISMHGV
jgi:hypothetical protein